MSARDVDVLDFRRAGHRDVPSDDRTAVMVHQETAEALAEVREAINEAAGVKAVTNDDLIRAAFHALGRVSMISENPDHVDEWESEVLLPLADVVRTTTGPEDWLPDLYAADEDATER